MLPIATSDRARSISRASSPPVSRRNPRSTHCPVPRQLRRPMRAGRQRPGTRRAWLPRAAGAVSTVPNREQASPVTNPMMAAPIASTDVDVPAQHTNANDEQGARRSCLAFPTRPARGGNSSTVMRELKPASRRRTEARAADDTIEQADSIAERRPEQPPQHGERCGCCRRSGQQLRRRRRIAEVRGHAIGQPNRAHRRARTHGDDHADGKHQPEQSTEQDRVHRNTRRSSGNWPIRSMMRYATMQTTAPTPSRTTPPVELYACNVVD